MFMMELLKRVTIAKIVFKGKGRGYEFVQITLFFFMTLDSNK